MQITFHSPVLISKDTKKMKNFYQKILKQQIEFDLGNCIIFSCGLTIWKLQPHYPLTQHLKYEYHGNGNKNLELCFETDEFEKVVQELKQVELNLIHDVTEENWGQLTIRFFDPENNMVEIGESMPCFVKRMYKNGLTGKEISEKTSLPLDKVREYVNPNHSSQPHSL